MSNRANPIATLNDRFRTSLQGGSVFVTRGILALGDEAFSDILSRVREFEHFDEDNDPHGEHDFGAFDHAGTKIFWKIDYYDRALKRGSPDPRDPAVTTRVLTVLLASEY